jgi:predicted nucleic acid-binding protein
VTGRAILDTSVYIGQEQQRRLRLPDPSPEIAVSVVTLAELWAGLRSATDDQARVVRLQTLEGALAVPALLIDRVVAHAWADLRESLRSLKRKMPGNDSWIAATALVHGLPVMTQDDDFADIPGLDVIRV